MKKTIILTGASSDIGLTLIEYLKDDYNLILIYNTHKNKLKKYVDNLSVIHCDFENEISKLITYINKKYVNIYGLINIATLTKDTPIEKINKKNFLNSYTVNVYAPLKLITKLNFKNGVIINISSTDALDTYNEYNIIYSLTKSSLIKLTEILSKYIKNAKIYALAPNFINTSIIKKMDPVFLKTELKRINQKELIETTSISKVIKELLNQKEKTGTIFRMDDNNEYRKLN